MMHEWAVRRRPEALDNYLVNFLVKCGSRQCDKRDAARPAQSRDVDTRNSVATALGAIDQEEGDNWEPVSIPSGSHRRRTAAMGMRPHCDCL